ncbi:MAG: DsrE family protein [Pseudomonadota bacterium]
MMKHKALTGAALASLLSLALVVPAQAVDKSKVVIQVSDADPAKWHLALNNARNFVKDLGKDNIDLEIVAYGPGIGMLKLESEVGNRVAETVESGIPVLACQNTMRNQKLNKEDMLASIGFVPAGVVEIMRKQQQGYAYLRP